MTYCTYAVNSMWQVRRCLNILQRASKEEIEDLFSTSSEVQKMNGMVQTLQIMLGAIEARKAVVDFFGKHIYRSGFP